MKKGKLSSALQERYGIPEEEAFGKVLWHSLNESGEINVYDMKFGNTIIRNLTENDIKGKKKKHTNESKHGVQKTNDLKRRQKE